MGRALFMENSLGKGEDLKIYILANARKFEYLTETLKEKV